MLYLRPIPLFLFCLLLHPHRFLSHLFQLLHCDYRHPIEPFKAQGKPSSLPNSSTPSITLSWRLSLALYASMFSAWELFRTPSRGSPSNHSEASTIILLGITTLFGVAFSISGPKTKDWVKWNLYNVNNMIDFKMISIPRIKFSFTPALWKRAWFSNYNSITPIISQFTDLLVSLSIFFRDQREIPLNWDWEEFNLVFSQKVKESLKPFGRESVQIVEWVCEKQVAHCSHKFHHHQTLLLFSLREFSHHSQTLLLHSEDIQHDVLPVLSDLWLGVACLASREVQHLVDGEIGEAIESPLEEVLIPELVSRQRELVCPLIRLELALSKLLWSSIISDSLRSTLPDFPSPLSEQDERQDNRRVKKEDPN